jgi:microcin C transport system substrate-binding protein
MLKKGELDYAAVAKAEWWVKDLPEVESVKRGLLVTRKFYTDNPVGTSGIAINMSREPLDDVKIRKALQYLYNREMMNEKLYFNEYEMLNSYYQGGVYQNMMNEYVSYDPFAAVKLLEEAGWTEKGSDGIRMKGGKRLVLTLTYRSKLSEEALVIYQDDAKKAGVDLQLQYLTGATAWENLTTKNYDLMSTAWGALIFPNPESGWKSDLADKKNNNNVTAFKSTKVDALLEKYNTEYEQAKRVEVIQEIDGLIYEQHPYVLAWFGPSQRVAFWNKFGMPKSGSDRFADSSSLFFSWWVDPAKAAELEKVRKDDSATMQRGRLEHRFWQAWNQSEAKRKAAEKKAAEAKAAAESTEDGAAPAGE